jgi:hypothetical protein
MDEEQENEYSNRLEQLFEKIDSLDGWSYSNAKKIEAINEEFLGIACALLDYKGKSQAGFIMEQDDTTTDIARAINTSSKRKDVEFAERYFLKSIRHLSDDIRRFLDLYKSY